VTGRLPPGFALHRRARVGSTNDEARGLALAGAGEGTVVLAAAQSAGRGRHGRAWDSPEGNLYASLLVRPMRPLAESAQLAFAAALAMAEAIEGRGPVRVALKWPNDLLVGGAKLGGFLLETDGEPGSHCAFLIIGSGVNLASHPDGLPYPATSLRAHGIEVTPEDLLGAYLGRFRDWHGIWRNRGFAPVRAAWLARAHGLLGPIALHLRERRLEGRFVDLAESGALLLEEPGGGLRLVTAGDVLFPHP
jgi:BirA family transcriptional regulator, biotin operon repressor / biotin---[acetyl-CoA-carboxylase] ligase